MDDRVSISRECWDQLARVMKQVGTLDGAELGASLPDPYQDPEAAVQEFAAAVGACVQERMNRGRTISFIADRLMSLATGAAFVPFVVQPGEDFDAVKAGLNMLHEELEASTVSREYADALINSMDDALIVVDATDTILDANRAAGIMTGTAESELLGLQLNVLFPDMSDGERSSGSETYFVRSTSLVGAEGPIAVSVSMAALPDGQRWVLVARDVRQEEILQAQLRNALLQAQQASEAKSMFLANMSHEIRTPINGVIGMTGLLADSNLDERQEGLVAALDVSGRTLLSVVNNVLDFSRIEAGEMQLESVEFDLGRTIESIADSYEVLARERGNQLHIVPKTMVPIRLQGDDGRLRQILANLVGNGIKFTERGDITIDVSVSEPEAGHVRASFVVRDTGIGMDQEQIGRLWTPFVQADASTTRLYGGSGLGLTICKELVGLMGGQIHATSTLGEGTSVTFSVTLRYPEQQGSRANIEGVRIAVLDSAPQHRTEVVDTLTRWGAIVSGVGGASGLDQVLEDSQIQVVLVEDRQFRELPQAVRQKLAGVRVITMVRMDATPSTDELVDSGLAASCEHPIRPWKLRSTIRRVLDSRARTPRPSDDLPSLSWAKVLVAEDNLINRKVLVALFAKLGLSPDVACDGLEAVEAYRNKPYDLILMDVRMPAMDGYQAAREIRRIERELLPARRRVTIIAHTADARRDQLGVCLDAGMDDYIAKPVTVENLIDRVESWLTHQPVDFITSVVMDPVTPTPTSPTPTSPTPTSPTPTPPADATLGVDIEQLRSLVELSIQADRPDMVPNLVASFETQGVERIRRIVAAVEANDYATIEAVAHTLRGSSGTIGAARFAEAATRIERAALQKDDALIANALAELPTLLQTSLASLRAAVLELS